MNILTCNELVQVEGAGPTWEAIKVIVTLVSFVRDVAIMGNPFYQDNGGPSATWENNGGYIG